MLNGVRIQFFDLLGVQYRHHGGEGINYSSNGDNVFLWQS